MEAVGLRGIAENLCLIGLVVHGQKNRRSNQDAAHLAFVGFTIKGGQQYRWDLAIFGLPMPC